MAQEHVPVLIVGAGGAGLSLSLLLHQQGISSLLIERRSDISWYPRARNLNFRTMEVFRGLGLAERIHAAGTSASRVFRKPTLASSTQEELLDPGSLFAGLEGISPEPFIWYCPQSRLEPLLLAEARKRGVDVRYGTELVSFTQDEMGVSAIIKDLAGTHTFDMRADYLIAADGAHSQVRKTLGIPAKGLGELDEHYIFVYFRADWSELVRDYGADSILIESTDVRSMILTTDQDRGMFIIMFAQGEAMQDYPVERCKALLLSAIGKAEIEVEIVDIGHWQPTERVAERFGQGRIFLVGDAAHAMPPKMGLGVNTAIQSAQNLAWKLAEVIHGHATPRLLETYQTERHPVGWLAAEQSLVGPAATFLTRGADSALLPEAKRVSLFTLIVGYRYRSQAIFSEDAGSSSQDELELLDQSELNGLPGTRVPHLWFEQQGQRISTLDLLDGRFVLLTGTDGIPWCEAATTIAANLGIGLAAYRIGSEGDLSNLESDWQTKLGMSVEGAVLLRPDGFVAWRSNGLPNNPGQILEQVFAHVLA